MQYPVRRAGLLSVIRDQLLHSVRTALDAVGFPEPAGGVALDPPKQREHGDWSTSVALQVAKFVGLKPREAATTLVAALEARSPPHVERLEIAGPGFINFHLAPTWLHEVLRDVVGQGERFGRS